MKLFRLADGVVLQHQDTNYLLSHGWDDLINCEGLYDRLSNILNELPVISNDEASNLVKNKLLPPISRQEVWAAGVTYLRSREARMEESASSGAADLYDRVYAAERPELFFKSMPHRVAGHGQMVYIRRDSIWNVPEPELALF
ncbi:MAG TPA: 2-hydroxyhepta-2,4-diene-1,7-dioate isomerase, partial [Mucilaginibacter sp.]|nr:2-hydroxyhepta-2,4-diene-1,7-dioate isomerase [Mucilaginibacter sp.]